MRKSCAVTMMLALGAGVAGADPYWVTYEATDFPENEGWIRHAYGGGDERYLGDGTLVLDGLASTDISDFYRWYMPSEPGPGEVFRMDWRLRVDSVLLHDDPAVSVRFRTGVVILGYSESGVYSAYEHAWVASFAPGLFHDYSLTTSDMRTYTLFLDQVAIWDGRFVGPFYESRVEWGDYTQGDASLAVWDYVRFGIVPEPTAGLLLGSAGVAVVVAKTRRTWRNSDDK
jgi:hypothetical protein